MMAGPSFGWHADSAMQGEWDFVLFDVRCHCGWFLAKAAPVMSEHGIDAVEGDCKRHGHITAESWNVIDAGELADA